MAWAVVAYLRTWLAAYIPPAALGLHIEPVVGERQMNIALLESYTGLLDHTGSAQECHRMVGHIPLMVEAFPPIDNHILARLPLDQLVVD